MSAPLTCPFCGGAMSAGEEPVGILNAPPSGWGEIVTRMERQHERDMQYLFGALPFTERHRWGGDWREFAEGVRAASVRTLGAL